MEGDSEAKFVPGGGIHLLGHDAEIAADVEEDGADRTVSVLGDDFGVHLLLGRGRTVEGLIAGRPTRRDGPYGGVPLARGRAPDGSPAEPPPPSPLPQGEGEKCAGRSEAVAEPGLERGDAEQAANDEDGDQRGIGGAEDAGGEGIPGEIIGVVFPAQGFDEVSTVGEESAKETEDVADARGVEARGHGPIGIGFDGCGRWCGCGVGHRRHIAQNVNPEQGFFSWQRITLEAGRRGLLPAGQLVGSSAAFYGQTGQRDVGGRANPRIKCGDGHDAVGRGTSTPTVVRAHAG